MLVTIIVLWLVSALIYGILLYLWWNHIRSISYFALGLSILHVFIALFCFIIIRG